MTGRGSPAPLPDSLTIIISTLLLSASCSPTRLSFISSHVVHTEGQTHRGPLPLQFDLQPVTLLLAFNLDKDGPAEARQLEFCIYASASYL